MAFDKRIGFKIWIPNGKKIDGGVVTSKDFKKRMQMIMEKMQ